MSTQPQVGDRVRLVRTSDPYTRLEPGTCGTVMGIDGEGTVHVSWDSGQVLGMLLHEHHPDDNDEIEVL